MKIELYISPHIARAIGVFSLLCALFVADFALSERRGSITSRSCPYSCATQGIQKRDCRDWRAEGLCFVEDLRTPSAPQQASNGCAIANMQGKIAPPRVDIFEVRSRGGMFTSRYQISGAVEGVCLVDAGYFEEGRKVAPITLTSEPSFRRFEFAFDVRDDRSPEIRVYNVLGDASIYPINPSREKRTRGGFGQ